jgi:NAD(P)H-flavin reductase
VSYHEILALSFVLPTLVYWDNRLLNQGEGQEEEFDKSKWNSKIGQINKDMILKYLSNDDVVNAVFYICGPPGMLEAIKNLLTTEMRITKDRIREEELYGY